MKNIILAVSIVIISCNHTCAQLLNYPKTKKVEQTDDYHGTKVTDPYRWLEDDHSLETKAWVMQENAITEKYMITIPFRDTLKARMTELWKSLSFGVPFKCGKSYFYYRHDGVQNQPVLFYYKSLEHVPFSYFDPNKISEQGTTAITQTIPSPDGTYLAFQVSKAGSDWNIIKINDTKTMKSLPDVISGVKFSSVAWYKNGFYYSRYENKGNLNAINEFHKVYYHLLNTPQEQDVLVWDDKEHPKRNFNATVSDDERFLIISGSESTSGNSVYFQDLLNPSSKLTAIVKGFDHDFDFLGNTGDRLLFLTNYKASRNKIISIDTKNVGEANWKDLIAEQKDILKSASLGFKNIITHYMKDASSHLYVFDINGLKPYEIPLTGFGTIESISASKSDSNLFFNYTTFTAPSIVYRYNLKTARLALQFKSQLSYNSDDLETKQVFYSSKDGTKIPMFLVHKKGVVPNGDLPTLLFGYGGFNISKTPEFKPERLVFLEQGGLLAVPNLRGGGEYGSDWHEAGTKLKKQNVFDDFIAAAEYLIKEKYTNSNRLAISGRSNGGLLVGAVMTQRPELFKVALPAVGVMDMLRFQKFTIGWAWTTDFGSSENAEEFKAIYKYSPLHNIRTGVKYPATMITTADHDDRVVPGHSFKFAAQLQENHQGENPVLIRVDVDAGHGSGKPTGKLINEQSDIFAFLFYNLGMKL
ncbi:MAG: prolyl oligopeptidase family serine peptidase [Bacteroidia bacterium]